MSFHEERFPVNLSFGAIGGPERRTEIVQLANGFEERNTPWKHSRRRYDAGMGLRSMDDLETVIAFFEARRGPLHGFRWKDWSDYRSARASADILHTDQAIGTGDGSTEVFQLSKRYGNGPGAYTRPVSKPVDGSVVVAVNDKRLDPGSEFDVDPSTGQIRFFTAPSVGAKITSGFEYDVPVRFDTDRIAVSLSTFRAGEIPDIPVVEVRV